MKFDERKVLINLLESGMLNARTLTEACKLYMEKIFDVILKKSDEEIKQLLLDFLKAGQNP